MRHESNDLNGRVAHRRDRPSLNPWVLDDIAPTLSEIREARSSRPSTPSL